MSFRFARARRWIATRGLSALRADGSPRLLFRNATELISIRLLGRLLGFGASLVLARSLGAEGYGVYVYVLGWLAFARLVSQLGMVPNAVRLLSGFQATGRWNRFRGFLATSRLLVFTASLAVAAVALTIADFSGLDPLSRRVLLVGAVSLPVFGLLDLTAAHLRGLVKVLASQSLESIVQQTAMLVLLTIAFLGPWTLDPISAMWLRWMAGAVALAWGAVLLRRALPAEVAKAESRVAPREELETSLPFLASAILGFAMNQTDVLVLGALAGPLAAGIFLPAKRLAALVDLGRTAVDTWLGPMIAELHARERVDELQQLVRRGVRVALLFTVPTALAVLLCGEWILRWFGPEFREARGAVVVLVLGAVARTAIGPARLVLSMTGHQAHVARLMGIYAALGVMGLIWVVPRAGATGAALVVVAARVLWEAHLAVSLHRSIGIRSSLW